MHFVYCLPFCNVLRFPVVVVKPTVAFFLVFFVSVLKRVYFVEQEHLKVRRNGTDIATIPINASKQFNTPYFVRDSPEVELNFLHIRIKSLKK